MPAADSAVEVEAIPAAGVAADSEAGSEVSAAEDSPEVEPVEVGNYLIVFSTGLLPQPE